VVREILNHATTGSGYVSVERIQRAKNAGSSRTYQGILLLDDNMYYGR